MLDVKRKALQTIHGFSSSGAFLPLLISQNLSFKHAVTHDTQVSRPTIIESSRLRGTKQIICTKVCRIKGAPKARPVLVSSCLPAWFPMLVRSATPTLGAVRINPTICSCGGVMYACVGRGGRQRGRICSASTIQPALSHSGEKRDEISNSSSSPSLRIFF